MISSVCCRCIPLQETEEVEIVEIEEVEEVESLRSRVPSASSDEQVSAPHHAVAIVNRYCRRASGRAASVLRAATIVEFASGGGAQTN